MYTHICFMLVVSSLSRLSLTALNEILNLIRNRESEGTCLENDRL